MVSSYCFSNFGALLEEGNKLNGISGFSSRNVTLIHSLPSILWTQNEKLKGLKYLYTQIHHFPDKPLLRKVLANYLLNNIAKNEKHSLAATCMVQGTIVMQRTHSKRYALNMIKSGGIFI